MGKINSRPDSIHKLKIGLKTLSQDEQPQQGTEATEPSWERVVRDSPLCHSHEAPRLQSMDEAYRVYKIDKLDEPDELEEVDEFDPCDECDESIDCDKCDKYKPNWFERGDGLVQVDKDPYASAKTLMIQLEEAEKLLGAMNRGEDYLDLALDNDPDYDLDLDDTCDYLPRQRITNVVQELDGGLFDASIMAVDLAIVKGKEWFQQAIERTAPLFNDAWKDGIFTLEKTKELSRLLLKIQKDIDKHFRKLESKNVDDSDKEPKGTRKRYTNEEWEKIIDLALLFLRIDPSISSDDKLAELVSKVYTEHKIREYDLSNYGKKIGNKDYQEKKKKIRNRDGKMNSTDPMASEEIKEEIKAFCEKEGLGDLTTEQLTALCITNPDIREKLKRRFE